MPPFNRKEVARFFLWVVVVAVALLAIVWFAFYSAGNKSIRLTRGGSLGSMAVPLLSLRR